MLPHELLHECGIARYFQTVYGHDAGKDKDIQGQGVRESMCMRERECVCVCVCE